MFKVVVNKNGKRYLMKDFEEYSEALDYAYDVNIKGEYYVLLLEQKDPSKKWIKKFALYPSEVC